MLSLLISLVLNLPPLFYVVIALVTLWYWTTRSRLPDNLPPFPCKPYPFVGHTPMIKSGPVEKFHEWRQSTGDIYSIYLGCQLVVVLNNLKLIKEALVKHGDVFSDRPLTYEAIQTKSNTRGILSNSGANWKKQRTVSMSILRSFGMGKNFLAEKIMVEVEAYLKALSDLKGQPTDVRSLTNASVSNVICALLIGGRFEFDDPYFVGLLKVFNEQVVLLSSAAILNSFPWLAYIPGDFFMAKKIVDNALEILHFSKRFINEFQKEGKDTVDNFITAYLSEMEKRGKSNLPTFLDEKNLEVVVANLFLAGSETTGTSLLWAMLFAIRHPDEQDKVYKEILEEVGSERLPSIQDRPRMNYTNAYIMETQRLGSIVPFSLNHLCIADTQIAGYTIPKGTNVLPNLEEVLKDKETWGDPLVFRPERFLDKDNNLVVPEEFIPFSIGRRYCMGESLAKMELFLYVTGIFQRFHIKPEDPKNLPPTKSVFGVTCCPEPYRPRLIQRQLED